MLDFGFGNSPCVRKAFLATYHGNMVVFTQNKLQTFDYPNRFGDEELIEITKKVIERQTGIKKKHVFITNGATGGVVIALRAFKQQGSEYCFTREAPWYLRYPGMIRSSGLKHLSGNFYRTLPDVYLMDIPSNPLGITKSIDTLAPRIVLDAVYFNEVYMSDAITPLPPHDILVGSYSKLLGLNGLRIGWVACDDDFLSEQLKTLITNEYCGLCVAGTEILKNILHNFNWDLFENLARRNLDANREEWSKLTRFFGDYQIPVNGMFYYSPIDQKAKKLLEKSDIIWTKGSELGTTNEFGRFNLGQDNELTQKAVNAILKNDKIKKRK